MRQIITILLFLSMVFNCSAQTDSLQKEHPSFTNMVVNAGNIYALNSLGQLLAWDLKTFTRTFVSDTSHKYTSISMDSSNNIFLGENGVVYSLDTSDYSVDTYLKLKKDYYISDIIFNSNDEMFLIIPWVIYDPLKDEYWADFIHQSNGIIHEKRFLIFFKRKTNKYFDLPQYTFVDSEDRIWMIKSFGEFGGSIQIFDSRNRKELRADIDSLNFGLLFPNSVFEDKDQNIYITSGLQHFTNSGDIFSIKNNKATKIYDSEDFGDTADSSPFGGGLFVGPGTYNPFDNKIYFATTEGFYRSTIPDEGRIENPELIFKVELLWDREPLAIGVSMAVKSIDFTEDNKLVFLTSNNGIGIYDGQELKMLK